MKRIGIDCGGTFTDLAIVTGKGIEVHKVPSTPEDPAAAVLTGLGAVRGRARVDVVHGTTVGLNAILTGRLARTAWVTNRGFEHLIEIGRQTRSDLYDLSAPRPEVPVPRDLRFGVTSRRGADGTVLAQADAAELDALRKRLAKADVEAIAIGLLHSYGHPEDERTIAAALAPLGVPITCSAELAPVHGEFERYCTAILNAAIAPTVGAYLERLERGVAPGQLRLMRSSGGIMAAAEATLFPARALFSGPAGGVVATRQHARALELDSVAALDMGGTSTDVCLVAPQTLAERDNRIAGLPVHVPSAEIHTIGCGGGSIAFRDAGGALRVGPDSAGADPGPACYGRGDAPTVTDAHMVLGHMGADTLLGGAFPVDPERSVGAVAELAGSLGLTVAATARGILEVAETAMMRALLVITVQRALDPMRIPLVAYGGAGGLHAASLAQRLDMPLAVVPPDPGAFSAVGLALARESCEIIHPVLRPLRTLRASTLRAKARDLGTRARATVLEQAGGSRVTVQIDALLRYRGQGSGVCVPFGDDLEGAFRSAHGTRYGFELEGAEVELVELRVRAARADIRLPAGPSRHSRRRPKPRSQRVPLGGGKPWSIYARADLEPGQTLSGPCLIEETTGVTRVPGGTAVTVHAAGLLLRVG